MISKTKYSMIVISVVNLVLIHSPLTFYDSSLVRKLGSSVTGSTSTADTNQQNDYNLPNDVVDKLKEIIKTGGQRGYYSKQEMDYLLTYPSPAFFCRHKIDPVDIWTDASKKQANLIGSGSFGTVYKGKYTATSGSNNGKQIVVAVKYVAYIRTTMLSLLKEINFLRRMGVSHHHLPFYQCFYEREEERKTKPDKRPQVIIMTDLMAGDADSLIKDSIKRNKFFGQHNHLQFLLNMAKGIKDMHIMSIIHRDIKPGNFFLDRNGNPIVGDLGLAEYVTDNGVTGLCGTPYYIPPEVLNGAQYSKPFDVYSLGVTFYVLVSAKNPSMFVEFNLGKNGGAKKSVVYYHLIRKSKYLALIQGMTKQNPSERLTIQQVIYELQYIQDNKKSSMTASAIVPPPNSLQKQKRNLRLESDLDNEFGGHQFRDFNKMII